MRGVTLVSIFTVDQSEASIVFPRLAQVNLLFPVLSLVCFETENCAILIL